MNPHFSNNYFPPNSGQTPKQEIKRLLFIDCRDRQPGMSPFDYTIYFEDKEQVEEITPDPTKPKITTIRKSVRRGIGVEPYRNIVKMELKHIDFPKIGGENYFVLDIPEIHDYIDSSDNRGSHRSSGIVFFDKSDMETNILRTSYESHVFSFSPHLPVLSQMTIRFRKYGGDLVSVNDFTETVDGRNSVKNERVSPQSEKDKFGDIDELKVQPNTLLFEVTYIP